MKKKAGQKNGCFPFRDKNHRWDPKGQRPELWNIYNCEHQKGESFRVFPLSNWTELDIWQYIYLENIPVPSLYLARPRLVTEWEGIKILVEDDERFPEALKKKRMKKLCASELWAVTR